VVTRRITVFFDVVMCHLVFWYTDINTASILELNVIYTKH